MDVVTNGKPIDTDFESIRLSPCNLMADSNSESESKEPISVDPVTDAENDDFQWLLETKYPDEIAIHVPNVKKIANMC